jgi:adenosylcobinamide-phosphate synthase
MNWPGPEPAAAALALIVERITGYPAALQRWIGHPVEWMGRLIAWLEMRLNDPRAKPFVVRLRGAAALLVLSAITLAGALVARAVAHNLPAGLLWEAALAVPFIAQKSLRDHVRAVLIALESSIAEGRLAVSAIVGRDASALDESSIAKAALESLAESTSDGVIAPLFWFAIAGLPGLALYKAINTADSMIGHRSPRYIHFGWASARLDDLINLPCSRLTGLLFVAAAGLIDRGRGRSALSAMLRDASKHVSPNAGWPEAALAGALGIRLGGPRSYAGRTVDLATMGHGRSKLTAEDIRRGLKLYERVLTLTAVSMVVLAVVF